MQRAPLLSVVVLLALACSCSSDASAEDRMIEWVRQAGGEGSATQVNVEVAAVDGLRGTAVTKDIPVGGTIAFVPQQLMYIACSNKDDPLVATAAKLMQEMANSSAPAALYWATMPHTQQELLSLYSFPMSYIPLLQTVAGEGYMMNQQSELERWWLENKGPLQKQDYTQENLQHAAGLLATRTFTTEFGTHTMIPLLDLANHETDCPNYRRVQPCPGNKDKQCMYWLAGKDYRKGEAACHSYGGMFNDRSFIQYGFVMVQPQPPHLYGVDRHDFDPEEIWGNQLFDKVMPEPFKSGTSSGYRQEADRLRHILYKLQRMDKAAGRTEVDDTDSTGQILSMVLRWRELRKAALTAEISRIRGILETRGEKLKAEAQYMKQVAAQAEEDDDDYGTMGGADDEDDEYADEL